MEIFLGVVATVGAWAVGLGAPGAGSVGMSGGRGLTRVGVATASAAVVE